MRHHILYFAIHADAEAAAQVADLMTAFRRRDTPSGRPVGPGGLHISLNALEAFDAYPDAVAARAMEVASRVRAPAFRIALNRLMTFEGSPPGQRPLVLVGDEGVVGVDSLYGAIAEALEAGGVRQGSQADIVPHMTLARGVAALPPEHVEPVSWQVREFALVHIPPGDQRHVLRVFPLLP